MQETTPRRAFYARSDQRVQVATGTRFRFASALCLGAASCFMGWFDFLRKEKPAPEGSGMSLITRFDTSKMHELPAWDFWLHFRIPEGVTEEELVACAAGLPGLPLGAARIASALTADNFIREERIFSIALSVPEERRRAADGLAAFEADVWRVIGHMCELNPPEVFYDAEGAP